MENLVLFSSILVRLVCCVKQEISPCDSKRIVLFLDPFLLSRLFGCLLPSRKLFIYFTNTLEKRFENSVLAFVLNQQQHLRYDVCSSLKIQNIALLLTTEGHLDTVISIFVQHNNSSSKIQLAN